MSLLICWCKEPILHVDGYITFHYLIIEHAYIFLDVYPSYLWLLTCAVLSQRLGLGKGGLRMAPEEALGEILQVGFFSPLSFPKYLSLKRFTLDKFPQINSDLLFNVASFFSLEGTIGLCYPFCPGE